MQLNVQEIEKNSELWAFYYFIKYWVYQEFYSIYVDWVLY